MRRVDQCCQSCNDLATHDVNTIINIVEGQSISIKQTRPGENFFLQLPMLQWYFYFADQRLTEKIICKVNGCEYLNCCCKCHWYTWFGYKKTTTIVLIILYGCTWRENILLIGWGKIAEENGDESDPQFIFLTIFYVMRNKSLALYDKAIRYEKIEKVNGQWSTPPYRHLVELN